VNGYCNHDQVTREATADGPLKGLRFAAKDVFAIAGARACYGNPDWFALREPARETAGVIESLLDAGASLTGMSVTDELALSLSGENAHYGTPINPRGPGRIAGGSSAGSASLVAQGEVDFALGTDTGGSVRVPASFCGLFGLRPTHGAISSHGVLPLAPRFDTVGLLTPSASMLQRVVNVLIRGPIARPRQLLLCPDARELVDVAAWPAFTAAAQLLASRLDVPLREFVLPDWSIHTRDVYLSLQNQQLVAQHRAFLERARFGSLVARRVGWAIGGGPLAMAEAEARRSMLVERLSSLLADGWLVLPSAPGVAPRIGGDDDATEAWTGRGLALSALSSLSGAPQLSLPIASVDGLPLGVSLLAAHGADRALVSAALIANEREIRS
jgi:amidase